MWTLRRADELSGGMPLGQWLERIPVLASTDLAHQRCARCKASIETGSFDVDASLFVSDNDQPAGLVLVTTSAEVAHLELVAVRTDLQRQGLATTLVQGALSALRRKGMKVVHTGTVSSRELQAVGLLTSLAFVGEGLGSLRMRRSLRGDLPIAEAPAGYHLRSLRVGEEAAWVELRNLCFPEDGHWQLDHFRQELSEADCFALDRILVATRQDRLVGTTIAWEVAYAGNPDGRPQGLIHWVGVDPEDRGVGLGKALNTMALGQLAERGYAEAWLNTSRNRVAAVGLYESLGFEVYRELDRYKLTL
ncbi:MAG TPA: GNAT family N-acetyltransferase [Candidatus Handelsmanbacteria bacterium]|nr:GNAT family N-acetyltransferase [Candidatus Handelsmanbacteria bacterium]